jgi:hypothetical protein
MAVFDMSGKRYGRLVIIERSAQTNQSGNAFWRCKCDCGNETIANGASIRAGRTMSCGCQSKAQRITAEKVTKHGMSRSRTYRIWVGMRKRCACTTKRKAHLYYGKGIRVCPEWESFDNFVRDMGEAPNGMTIERIDGLQGYRPGNCRWASPKEQANNTTKNKKIVFQGREQNLSQWAEEFKLKPNTLLYRLKRGWDVEQALTR